jgi:glycosyltransferase involved in cell wall biosynthesis
MLVTFVLPSFAGGGAERVILNLANQLDSSRFETNIVALDETGPLRDRVSAHVPVIGLGHSRLRYGIGPLLRVLRQNSPNIVVSTIGYINVAILTSRRLLRRGTHIVIREANTPSMSLASTNHPALLRFLYRHFYPRADAILCPSTRISSELCYDFGITAGRLELLHNPIDIDGVRTAARSPLRIPGLGARFVAAGRMTEQKAFDRLIDAMELLGADTHLTLLGDGKLLPELKQQVRRLNLADRVHFQGFVAEPWRHFAGADALVMPSRWEGMPNAALEALACGVPVIATPEAGGMPELAAMAPHDAVRLAEGMDSLVATMRTVVGSGSELERPSLLPQEFWLDTVVERFEGVLERVASIPRH